MRGTGFGTCCRRGWAMHVDFQKSEVRSQNPEPRTMGPILGYPVTKRLCHPKHAKFIRVQSVAQLVKVLAQQSATMVQMRLHVKDHGATKHHVSGLASKEGQRGRRRQGHVPARAGPRQHRR